VVAGKRQLAIYNLNETWQAFEFLVNQGLVNNIGLSNFTARQIERIWKTATIKPANLQLECHCYLQQHELETYCHMKNIVMSAYSPIGAPGKPDRGKKEPILHEDPVVAEIAQMCKRSPTQILLNFLLDRKMAVIVKSQNVKNIEENFQVFDFSLQSEHHELLEQLDRNHRYFRFEWAASHPEFSDEPF
jgi:diketogulonate reductase-like aldo/keto reductase